MNVFNPGMATVGKSLHYISWKTRLYYANLNRELVLVMSVGFDVLFIERG